MADYNYKGYLRVRHVRLRITRADCNQPVKSPTILLTAQLMKYLFALVPICGLLFSTSCTQSPEKLIATANKYHQNKKYKEASILYQKALAKDKTNAEAYYREGLNLLDDGNPQDSFEASKYLRRAVDLKPDNTDAETKLAEIYLSVYASNPKKFKTLLPDIKDLADKVNQHAPNSFNGARLQAFVYLTEKDTPKALESFAKANRIKPYSRELVGWYAETLASAGRGDEAEALVRDMIAHDKTWGPGYDFLFFQAGRQGNRNKAEAVLRQRAQNDPLSPVAVSNLANYLLSTGRFDEGQAVMHRVLDDKKAFPVGRQMMGDFYFHAKKFDQALQQYQAGANEDPKNALAYNQRVMNVYLATGRREDAIQLARTLASKNPKNASANEAYASLLLGTGSKEDASRSLSELKALVQSNPANAALHLDLARAYFSLNNKDKSLSEALEALQEEQKVKAPRNSLLLASHIIAGRIYEDRGQHAKAMEQTDVVLAADANNPDARLIRDRALIGVNESDRAQPDLEALLQQYPGATDARLVLAGIYLNQKQYDKAAQQYDHVWKSNPPDNRGFVGLQTVKLAEGKGEDAIQALQDLVQKNPKILEYRYQLAGFEATAGAQAMKSNPTRANQLFEQAAEGYKEILKTTSNAADVWLRLGVLQRQLKQYDAALASFEQAGNADPHNASAFLNEAMLFDNLGKRKEATDGYNKVLGIDPENALALNNLAYINADEKTNLDLAMSFAARAKKKAPDSPDVSDTLGYVYYQKNMNAEALRIFRQVVADAPQNPTFHFHLAMALLKEGDKQGARTEAEKALKNSSQPDEQKKIRLFVNQIG